MRKFSDKEILDRIEKLPTFQGWKKGVVDCWIRSKADLYDQFDDRVFTYEVTADGQRPRFVMAATGTTNAGSYGLKDFQKYNPSGCAVLKSDVIVYDSHIYGSHKGYPAYRQNKGFPYFRDTDRDNKAEETGREYTDIILANCHKAGLNSTVIKNWSVACLVRNRQSDWFAWMLFMAQRKLSVCILKEF